MTFQKWHKPVKKWEKTSKQAAFENNPVITVPPSITMESLMSKMIELQVATKTSIDKLADKMSKPEIEITMDSITKAESEKIIKTMVYEVYWLEEDWITSSMWVRRFTSEIDAVNFWKSARWESKYLIVPITINKSNF